MRRMIRLATVMLFVMLASSAWAQDEPLDIENVPTPVSLVELLPPGGIAELDIESWVSTQLAEADEQARGTQSYQHWSIKPVDGKLVITYQIGNSGPAAYHKRRRSVYTADGTLVSYQQKTIWVNSVLRSVTHTGQVVDDHLILETAVDTDTKGPLISKVEVDEPRKIPLKIFNDAMPPDWLPLVLAYHIRQGSLGYSYTTTDVSRKNERVTSKVENQGTEQVQFEGANADAHLLRITEQSKAKDNDQASITMLVLEDGSVLNQTNRTKTTKMNFLRSSKEEVFQLFALDEVQFKQDP